MGDKKLVLGLDVSTATIGCCLMMVEDDKRTIVKATAITPKVSKNIVGVESLFIKKQIFEDEFLKKIIDLPIDKVIIEEPLLFSNNVNTVASLVRFNILISDSIYRLFNIVPDYISSYDARANAFKDLVGIRKFNKKGERITEGEQKKLKPTLFSDFPLDVDKKQVILDKVCELYPDLEFTFNKKGDLLKTNYDVTDAITVVLGWLNKPKETEEEKEIKKENKKKKKSSKKAAE